MTSESNKPTHCPNCGQPLAAKDRYCRNCGQSTRDLRVPFKHLLFEALEGIFHIDNNFIQTAGALLFKPGFLTNEYIAGRRKKYVPPVRLYIFISFVFFLLLALNPGKYLAGNKEEPGQTEQQNFFDSDLFHISFNNISSDKLKGLNNTQIDSVLAANNISPSFLNKYMARRLSYMATSGKAEFKHQTQKGLSYMMFILMPVLAALLYLFNRKKAKYYIDCLIFSVHFHSFIFLILVIYIIISWFASSLFILMAVLLTITIYFLFSLKNVFHQAWLLTLLKTLMIGGLHAIAFLFAFLIVIMISVAIF
jgi:hypothetical protein